MIVPDTASNVSVAFEYDRITALDESPVVPVVTPVHVIVQVSVPFATFVKTYILPPDAVPLVLGNPDTSVQPADAAAVAVMLRQNVMQTITSPFTVEALLTGVSTV